MWVCGCGCLFACVFVRSLEWCVVCVYVSCLVCSSLRASCVNTKPRRVEPLTLTHVTPCPLNSESRSFCVCVCACVCHVYVSVWSLRAFCVNTKPRRAEPPTLTHVTPRPLSRHRGEPRARSSPSRPAALFPTAKYTSECFFRNQGKRACPQASY